MPTDGTSPLVSNAAGASWPDGVCGSDMSSSSSCGILIVNEEFEGLGERRRDAQQGRVDRAVQVGSKHKGSSSSSMSLTVYEVRMP